MVNTLSSYSQNLSSQEILLHEYTDALLAANSVNKEFSGCIEVMADCEYMPIPAKRRLDLRDILCFSIDGYDPKERGTYE